MSQLADETHFYGSKLIVSTDLKFPEGFSSTGDRPTEVPVSLPR